MTLNSPKVPPPPKPPLRWTWERTLDCVALLRDGSQYMALPREVANEQMQGICDALNEVP
jgi:hypothetical protein